MTEDFTVEFNGNKLALTRHGRFAPEREGVLALHGGGESDRTRVAYLLKELAVAGHHCISVDFSGHGESTGSVGHSSLDLRAQEALAAWKSGAGKRPLAVVGTSMGAHVACTLIPILQPRLAILFAPAAYATSAQSLRFDLGFTEEIRRPRSYLDSKAFASLSGYRGSLLVIIGTRDGVIPQEVVTSYLTRPTLAQRVQLLRVDGAEHAIHSWLQLHDHDRAQTISVIKEALAFASAATPLVSGAA